MRGLVAACLGSGILGELWRLLMQGEKSIACSVLSMVFDNDVMQATTSTRVTTQNNHNMKHY
jgi:hypothetical protein